METVAETEQIVCKYCKKTFRKISTLSVHLCEPKRRWQQKDETGVQLGLRAFLKFFEHTQGSAQTKNYEEFVKSPYYSAFVKFGQYLVQIRCINTIAFTDWVIKKNAKLDHWTRDSLYDEYLFEYLRKEHPDDALTRSFTEMQRWADESGKSFNNIFREGAANKVCNMIINGRISPWILYSCDSGVEFLSTLNNEQVAMIFRHIEPDFWQRKLKDHLADAEMIKLVLLEADV